MAYKFGNTKAQNNQEINKALILSSKGNSGDVLTSQGDEADPIWQSPSEGSGLAAYPIGAVYFSKNSTAPGSLFGGGWSPISEATLRIVTSGAGSYKGSKTIAQNNLPDRTIVDRNTQAKGFYASEFKDFTSTGYKTGVLTSYGVEFKPYYYGVYAWVRTS